MNGPLISHYELQAVPFFDLHTIRSILPLITIEFDATDPVNLSRSISSGKNELLFRLSHTLQRQRGYGKNGAYLGSRQGAFIRFAQSGKRLSFAFLAEKDPGERWIDKNRRQLMDFQSFHVVLHRPLKWLDQVILGGESPGRLAHVPFFKHGSRVETASPTVCRVFQVTIAVLSYTR